MGQRVKRKGPPSQVARFRHLMTCTFPVLLSRDVRAKNCNLENFGDITQHNVERTVGTFGIAFRKPRNTLSTATKEGVILRAEGAVHHARVPFCARPFDLRLPTRPASSVLPLHARVMGEANWIFSPYGTYV